MAASFITENGTVTIRFEWQSIPIARAQEIVNYAALYDHNCGLGPTVGEGEGERQVPFGELTNQQKLTMTFEAAQRLIIAQAKAAYINEQQDAAKAAATEYADEEYDLG